MDASGSTLAQELFDGLTAMGRQAIPNDEQLARNMAQQVFEKAHNVGTFECFILDHRVQLAFRRNGTNDRQMFPMGILEDGRFPAQSVGSYRRRQQIEAGCIEKYYGSALDFGLF